MPLETAGLEVVTGAEEAVLVVEDWVEGAWEETWRFGGISGAKGTGVVEDSKVLCRREFGEVFGAIGCWQNIPRES